MMRDAWRGASGAVVGGADPVVLWHGLFPEVPAPEDAPYARISVKHDNGLGQTSLGGVGRRQFTRTGHVFVQCFVPLGIGNPLTIALRLGRIALNAYEGHSSPGGIWFRNCRINEVGPADGRYQVNAVIQFTYDEVK